MVMERGTSLHLGIFSNVVSGATPEEVAARTRQYGLTAVQFIPAASGIGFGFDRSQPAEDFRHWAAAYRQEGIDVAAVGGYINLLHQRSRETTAQYRHV